MKQLASLLPSFPKQRKALSPKPISKRHLQLVNLAREMAENRPQEKNTLGFMSRLLIMVNLPYRDPGDDKRTWYRKNGNVSIDVNSGTEDGIPIGLPYGAYPRLILHPVRFYLCA